MPTKAQLAAAAAIVAIVAVAVAAYLHHRKKAGFVGGMARAPGMRHCLALGDSLGRTFHFNRCNYL